jgi:hypothetical protein
MVLEKDDEILHRIECNISDVGVEQQVWASKMARGCELRKIRLVKEMENRNIRMLDSGDYPSDIEWASLRVSGGGEQEI